MPLLATSLRRLKPARFHPGWLNAQLRAPAWLRPDPPLRASTPAPPPVSTQVCASAACHRTFRDAAEQGTRRFEGKPVCSEECRLHLLRQKIRSEILFRRASSPVAHTHRIPLGLVLLSLGAITSEQLQSALAAQRKAGQRRIGHWLCKHAAITQKQVTHALSLQWGCAVFDLAGYRAQRTSIPREIVESYGMLPILAYGRGALCLAFENGPDALVAYVVQHMTGLRVESGVAEEGPFTAARARSLEAQQPASATVIVGSEQELFDSIACILQDEHTATAFDLRIARLHGHIWLRLLDQETDTQAHLQQAHAFRDYLFPLPVPQPPARAAKLARSNRRTSRNGPRNA